MNSAFVKFGKLVGGGSSPTLEVGTSGGGASIGSSYRYCTLEINFTN